MTGRYRIAAALPRSKRSTQSLGIRSRPQHCTGSPRRCCSISSRIRTRLSTRYAIASSIVQYHEAATGGDTRLISGRIRLIKTLYPPWKAEGSALSRVCVSCYVSRISRHAQARGRAKGEPPWQACKGYDVPRIPFKLYGGVTFIRFPPSASFVPAPICSTSPATSYPPLVRRAGPRREGQG